MGILQRQNMLVRDASSSGESSGQGSDPHLLSPALPRVFTLEATQRALMRSLWLIGISGSIFLFDFLLGTDAIMKFLRH